MSQGLGVVEAVLLGILQGVTEWLPVSSSGHLVLAQAVLGVDPPLFFDLFLHLGTLLVVLAFYRKAIWEMLRAVAGAPAAYRATRSWRETVWADPARRLAFLVVVGTVPTAIIGFTFEDRFDSLFGSPVAVGVALLLTGTFLWFTQYFPDRRGEREFGLADALLIGTVQGAAITPGISRSGSTIAAATYRGLDRELAVRYSFLLSVPAILGAAVLKTDAEAVAGVLSNLPAHLAGLVAAVLVGYACLAALVYLAKHRKLHWFALYCWALGGGTLAFFLTRA